MNETHRPKTSPRDFFLHLLHMVALYASAISFTALIFQYVNTAIPDPVLEGINRPFVFSSTERIIRQSLAVLLVMFPVLIVSGWALEKLYARYKEKRKLRVRRWLIYGTLFISSIIIIVDLITLIMNFLEGEVTTRFFMKFLTVLFVSSAIFGYYLRDVRKEKEEDD